MAAEEAPKGASRRSMQSIEDAEEVPEIVASRGSDNFNVQTYHYRKVLEDDVRPKPVHADASERHYKLLASADNVIVLDYIWKETAFRLRTKKGAVGAGKHVCVGAIGGLLWQADEELRQTRAKWTGVPTRFQAWFNAPEGDAKTDAGELLKKEKQRYVMRAKRVVEAACAYGLVTKTTIRNNNLVAVRGTPRLNKLMTRAFVLSEAGRRSVGKGD